MGTEAFIRNASEAQAERAIVVLKRAIDAAENSNQAGENFVVGAANWEALLAALKDAVEPLETALASKQALWDSKYSECSNEWRVRVLREIEEAKTARDNALDAIAKATGGAA